MTYSVSFLYRYFTQELANDKVRLFALEDVLDDDGEVFYDNLRVVATYEFEVGGDLCGFLNDFLDDVEEEMKREGVRDEYNRGFRRGKVDDSARARAAQRVAALPHRGSSLGLVVGYSSSMPTAVRTAVLAELAKQGIDVAAYIESWRAYWNSRSGAESAVES